MAAFTSAERFPCALRFGTYVRRFIPMLVVMCLIPLVILRALRLGWPLVLVLIAVFAMVFVARLRSQFNRMYGSTELELSPAGATVVRQHSRVHMPWSGIRQIGAVDLVTLRTPFLGNWRAWLLGVLITSTARRRKQPALIGSGPGHPVVTIMLTVYDKDWAAGRIGEWVRQCRPDLLHQVSQQRGGRVGE